MSSNQKTTGTKNPDPATAPALDAVENRDALDAFAGAPAMNDDGAAPGAGNDNAAPGGVLDTTQLVARPDVVRYIEATLRRYGVAWQDMADAVAEVQTDAIEAARTKRMPATRDEWKALAVAIAVCWAIDRLRAAEVRDKYDAGLCDDADAYARPTLHWEQRDPVDTKRYLAILKDLFDSGQMPEDGAEILWGEADGAPHAEIAAELGVTETVVKNRLFRMRATFRARLAALGLTFVLLLVAAALSPVGGGGVAASNPSAQQPVEPAPPVRPVPGDDAGAPRSENRHLPSDQIDPFPIK